MVLTKKKNYSGTIRKVWNDDKTKVLGLIGTVGDLLGEGVFESCDVDRDWWAGIHNDSDLRTVFGRTRDELISNWNDADALEPEVLS